MVEALWVKKVQPASKAVTYFAIVIGLYVLSFVLSISGAVSAARTGHTDSSLQGIQGIISLGILIMNVLVLGSRVIGVKLAEDLVKAFVGANFTNEERHKRRLAKVKALEDKR